MDHTIGLNVYPWDAPFRVQANYTIRVERSLRTAPNDLFELVSIFHEAGIREFSIVTNGTFTEKTLELAEKTGALPGSKLTIQVSLDGPESHLGCVSSSPFSFR